MKTILTILLLAAALLSAQQPEHPKLLLAIVVDQFRYDYLTRFRSEYNAGLSRLLEKGAVFTNANYEHFPTVTAIGHSTFLTGALPSVSGIIGNEWYDRSSGAQVTSVTDATVKPLGGPLAKPSSPRRLLVSTIADELKMAGRESKAIGISIKDRSAILPLGRMADAAYWFDENSGNFVSSTYYFPDLPGWVKDYNGGRPADRYAGVEWKPVVGLGGLFKKMGSNVDAVFYKSMERTPFGNELIESFAERAIASEGLGRHKGTDVLAVSFSSNDYIGHDLGPDAPEVRDISIRTDRLLGKLLDFIDAQIGLDKVLVVMTADHGVAPLPEMMEKRRMPGGRMTEETVHKAIEAALIERFGPGKWLVGKSGPAPYFNQSLIQEKKLTAAAVERVAAEAALRVPHIARVYTRSQLLAGQYIPDLVGRRVANGFHPARAADLAIVAEPYWMFEAKGTSHGTPYNYDSHVPVIFMGPAVKPGRYRRPIAVNDIAPTVAAILDIETPSGSGGRQLEEILMLH